VYGQRLLDICAEVTSRAFEMSMGTMIFGTKSYLNFYKILKNVGARRVLALWVIVSVAPCGNKVAPLKKLKNLNAKSQHSQLL